MRRGDLRERDRLGRLPLHRAAEAGGGEARGSGGIGRCGEGGVGGGRKGSRSCELGICPFLASQMIFSSFHRLRVEEKYQLDSPV